MKNILNLFKVVLYSGSLSLTAQSIITGKIVDRNNKPIAEAIISVRGDKAQAITDSTGVYKIEVAKKYPFTLQISTVGYKPVEIELYEAPEGNLESTLREDNLLGEVEVSSRRRKENVQDIPIAVAVVAGEVAENTGSFNVNRVKEIVPSVQLYSSNPRNTTLNIRGLGSTFGLTNDGLDPGVGFYVDGVYYARPAATALDFIDVDKIEVLRGPQSTLYGKNTTAGTFNITSRRPTFDPTGTFEVSYGNYNYVQARASVSGPVSNKVATRISFSGTNREGNIYNNRTEKYINTLNNLGIRAQVLYRPNNKLEVLFAIDGTRQRPDGYAQVVAGVARTRRNAYRQFDAIINDLNYKLPSTNPFDRVVDQDTPWRSDNDFAGASLNVDYKIGNGTLTSTTAWRWWKWGPSNDRDFTGLSVLSRSQAPSVHNQYSQEFRYAGKVTEKISGVVGLFALGQELLTDPYHTEESGNAQWRFSQSTTSTGWSTPGLLDGYGIRTTSRLDNLSAAAFAQADWEVIPKLHILPGFRVNFDRKVVDYSRVAYGGLVTTVPSLLTIKRGVYNNQAFNAAVQQVNYSGQLSVNYKFSEQINAYATYSLGFKPIGINLGGLPNDASGQPDLSLVQVKPEFVSHYEAGVKTSPTLKSTLNLSAYYTDIKDYQTVVQTPDLSVNRGYLANAEKVRVFGVELDGNISVNKYLTLFASYAYTDGIYVSFTNAPVPLEETGGPSFKDISGGALPGISKHIVSAGGELTYGSTLLNQKGKFFLGSEGYYRSSFSSSPSPSTYLNIDEYFLLNGRLGFRSNQGFSIFVWGRNLLNKNYFEQLLPAAGNAGHYAGVLGDPRTYGVTLRHSF
ncbi:MAG: TonB-dependent receptor [Cytophagales bacterium]|nr:TonB-dependent receptor [Cytophagales bacterium]